MNKFDSFKAPVHQVQSESDQCHGLGEEDENIKFYQKWQKYSSKIKNQKYHHAMNKSNVNLYKAPVYKFYYRFSQTSNENVVLNMATLE